MVGWLETLFDHHLLFLPVAAVVIIVVVVVHPLPLSVADPDCSVLLLPPSMECPIPHCAHQILHDPAHGI